MNLFGKKPAELPEIGLGRDNLAMQERVGMADIATKDDQGYENNKDERENLLRWQQDLDPDLINLYYSLRRYIQDENGDWIPIKENYFDALGKEHSNNMKPMLNKFGAISTVTYLRNYLNRNTMRCNIGEEQIRKKMKMIGNSLVFTLGENYDTYGIDMSEFKIVNQMIRDVVHFTLLRAYKDGERKSEREIRKSIETNMIGREKELSRGLFGGKI